MRLECYWCEHKTLTELGRIAHLYTKHPQFFELYDDLNGWKLFEDHTIPDKPSEEQ